MKEVTILTEVLAKELNSFIDDCAAFGVSPDEAIDELFTCKRVHIFNQDYKVTLNIERM